MGKLITWLDIVKLKELMKKNNMICKQCKKEFKGPNTFCSKQCRNLAVSDFMVKKSRIIKKKIGNSYYSPQQNG